MSTTDTTTKSDDHLTRGLEHLTDLLSGSRSDDAFKLAHEIARRLVEMRRGELTPEVEQLRGNDGFSNMVLRQVESMYTQAPIDDLVVFAYGSWEAAQAAWGELQRSRFRRLRSKGRAAA